MLSFNLVYSATENSKEESKNLLAHPVATFAMDNYSVTRPYVFAVDKMDFQAGWAMTWGLSTPFLSLFINGQSPHFSCRP